MSLAFTLIVASVLLLVLLYSKCDIIHESGDHVGLRNLLQVILLGTFHMFLNAYADWL